MTRIALNMIVGPGDAKLLNRCLMAFDAKNTFSEIILVPTTDDIDVWQVCKQWTEQLYPFTWESIRYPHGNFAGARNLALQNTKAEYVMWLDCDDLPSSGFTETFPTIEQVLGRFDIFTFDYVVQVESSLLTRRERVWRRRPTLFWQYPVHEQLTVNRNTHTMAHIGNLQIVHSPEKKEVRSSSRNLRILEHEYKKSPESFVASFYYFRELLYVDNKKAINGLQELVDCHEKANPDILAQICVLLCEHFSSLHQMENVETYSRIGMSFNPTYADFMIVLAEIYQSRKENDKASELYKKALSTSFSGGGVYNAPLYSIVPAVRLMNIYEGQGQWEAALVMSKTVLQYTSRNERGTVVESRKALAQRIIDQCQV